MSESDAIRSHMNQIKASHNAAVAERLAAQQAREARAVTATRHTQKLLHLGRRYVGWAKLNGISPDFAWKEEREQLPFRHILVGRVGKIIRPRIEGWVIAELPHGVSFPEKHHCGATTVDYLSRLAIMLDTSSNNTSLLTGDTPANRLPSESEWNAVRPAEGLREFSEDMIYGRIADIALRNNVSIKYFEK